MWQESNTWPVFGCCCAEPEKLCGSASPTSSKTPPSPKSWRMTPPPSAGWPSWWRTYKRVRSLIPGASLSPHSDPPLPIAPRPPWGTPAKNCLTAEPSIMDTELALFLWKTFKKERLLPAYFLWTHMQANSLSLCDSVLMDPRFQRHWLFLPHHVFRNQFTDLQ